VSTIKSRKAKARKLQQWVRDKIKDLLNLDDNTVTSTIMGMSGEDVVIHGADSRSKFPYSIECKNCEQMRTVWKYYNQAQSHTDYEPLLIIKRNHEKPLAIVDAEYFIKLHSQFKSDNIEAK